MPDGITKCRFGPSPHSTALYTRRNTWRTFVLLKYPAGSNLNIPPGSRRDGSPRAQYSSGLAQRKVGLRLLC